MLKKTQEKIGWTEWEVRSFDKVLENIKKNQIEMKNTITEIKNTLEGIHGRLDDTEVQISELEDRVVEITEVEQKKE